MQKGQYDEILFSLDIIKKQILNQNQVAQQIIDDLRKIIPPKYVAKFLMDLDNKRMDNKQEQDNGIKNVYPHNLWKMLCESKDKK